MRNTVSSSSRSTVSSLLKSVWVDANKLNEAIKEGNFFSIIPIINDISSKLGVNLDVFVKAEEEYLKHLKEKGINIDTIRKSMIARIIVKTLQQSKKDTKEATIKRINELLNENSGMHTESMWTLEIVPGSQEDEYRIHFWRIFWNNESRFLDGGAKNTNLPLIVEEIRKLLDMFPELEVVIEWYVNEESFTNQYDNKIVSDEEFKKELKRKGVHLWFSRARAVLDYLFLKQDSKEYWEFREKYGKRIILPQQPFQNDKIREEQWCPDAFVNNWPELVITIREKKEEKNRKIEK